MSDTDNRPIERFQSATSMTDGVKIAKRNDGSLLIQFISSTPDELIENHRTVMTHEGVKNLIDALTGILNYYPVE